MVNLAANNYLGLADDERVKNAQKRAIDAYGASLCGTPIATGTTDLALACEAALNRFVGLEAGMVFPSCYQANVGVFGAFVTPDDALLFDHYCHASLVQGMQSTRAKLRPFLHNDLNHLEKQLKASQGAPQVFVVVESVYSTEGSIAPLAEIVALCQVYDAIPVVDDSHGIGVIGRQGRGILDHAGVSEFPGIYTASLGKALANAGGYVGGAATLVEFLKYRTGAYVYSTALVPSLYGGTLEVLALLEQEHRGLFAKLQDNTRRIRSALEKIGLPLAPAGAPITAINSGSLERTALITKSLFEKGVFVTPFIPPSVPENQGKVRLIAGANLGEASLAHCEAVLGSLG